MESWMQKIITKMLNLKGDCFDRKRMEARSKRILRSEDKF